MDFIIGTLIVCLSGLLIGGAGWPIKLMNPNNAVAPLFVEVPAGRLSA